MDVVVLYTDVLYNTPSFAAAKNGSGDLPAVIGSFSADFDGKMWKVTANADDVIKPQEGFPDVKDYAKLLAGVRKILKDRTGYDLVSRPVGLEGLHFPTDQAAEEKIEKIVKAAVAAGEINDDLDRGFDINPDTKRK
jgi:hypothetical protein